MACLTTTYTHNLAINDVFQLRLGERAISIHQDFRKRLYPTNPIIEFCAGVRAGHLEILLFRHWLVAFSKAKKRN